MSRSPLVIRTAVPGDASVLTDLWSDALRRGEGADQLADCLRAVTRAAASEDERLVVVEYDGEIAGAVYLCATTVSPLNTEPIVHAISPQVFERFRRHGVGSALMEASVSFAEERGIAHLAAPTSASSRDANRFMARIALGPYAVLRVATTHAVRARLTVHRRPVAAGGRQLTQVLAARRSLRRSRAGIETQ